MSNVQIYYEIRVRIIKSTVSNILYRCNIQLNSNIVVTFIVLLQNSHRMFKYHAVHIAFVICHPENSGAFYKIMTFILLMMENSTLIFCS